MHCLEALSLVAIIAATPHAFGQATTERALITGRSLGGFVLPTKPIAAGCRLTATRGWTWKTDDTQRLYLEGDVRVTVGGYSLTAQRAIVWVNRLPLGGEAATQLAIWFDHAQEPTRRAGLGASGKELLITATTMGSMELSLLITEQGSPTRAPTSADERRAELDTAAATARAATLTNGEAALSRYLRGLTARIHAGTQRVATVPLLESPSPIVELPLVPGGAIGGAATAAASTDALPDSIAVVPAKSLPIFEPNGTVSFSADRITIDEKADRVSIQGMVEIEYRSADSDAERTLQLSAERAVLFLTKDALTGLRTGKRSIDASAIQGIYLEGAAHASDGSYTLRGAQLYYDLASNRAAVVDAVLRTYDRNRKDLPIYVRAAELRQVAREEWTAERATISTSEFFTPHLAIGVDRVTVTKEPAGVGSDDGGVWVHSEGAGIMTSGTRILPLPGYEGRVDRIPIRSIDTGYADDRGVEIGTSWDLAAVFGLAPTPGVDSELRVDGYSERGAAVGATFRMTESMGQGVVDLYGLYDTGGDDRTSSGVLVPIDEGMRGIVDAHWATALDPTMTLKSQFSYISDETFVSSWRQRAFDERREYETSTELNRTSDNSTMSLVIKHDLNDFISNSYLLASRGYTVDKIPELVLARYGDEPLEGVTWTQEWSATAMALRPTTGTPALLGVRTGAWGDAIGANDSIASAYDSAGYTDGTIGRLDTRHEFSIPMVSDGLTVTPFVSSEATGYLSDELTAYTADVETIRLQAGGGVRASMHFVRVDDTMQSRLLDLNRMRHILEPYSTLWTGVDSLDAGALPIYDQSIEGSSAGSAANIGLRQTLQTQRGGPGAWQSVDWLKLDMGVVLSDGSSEFTPTPVDPLNPFASLRWSQSPIPAFYSFRPELSQWGSHAYGASTWQVSDSLTLGGTVNYLFEDRDFITDDDAILQNLARASLGIEMRHNPAVSTYIEYRYVAPTSTELLQAGALYRISKRYLLAMSPQYDLEAGEFRAVGGSLTRGFPDFDLNANARYDLVEDQTVVGLSLSIPAGSRSGAASAFGAYNPSLGGTR